MLGFNKDGITSGVRPSLLYGFNLPLRLTKFTVENLKITFRRREDGRRIVGEGSQDKRM